MGYIHKKGAINLLIKNTKARGKGGNETARNMDNHFPNKDTKSKRSWDLKQTEDITGLWNKVDQ